MPQHLRLILFVLIGSAVAWLVLRGRVSSTRRKGWNATVLGGIFAAQSSLLLYVEFSSPAGERSTLRTVSLLVVGVACLLSFAAGLRAVSNTFRE